MPTYEYECKTCGMVMDVFQSITAAPLRKALCEHCKTERAVRRLIGTGGGLIFKGSGFYQTDYRSEGYKNAAKAESPSDASAGSKETKSETTTAGEKKEPAKPAPSSDQSSSASSRESKPDKPSRSTTKRRR